MFPIVQADDYFLGGLTFNSYRRENSVGNRYLFNGIERQKELDLNWDLAEFRSYSQEIGRWHQVDPKASERESPYVGFANNPILFSDPLGDTVDISNLTPEKQEAYNLQIAALQESKMFNDIHS